MWPTVLLIRRDNKVFDVKPEVLAAFNKGERVMVVSQEEMDRMAERGAKRLFNQIKEDMADLDSRISICEAIAKDPIGSSVPNIKRDER